MKNRNHSISGYIVIQAELETVSPLRIGSGLDDRSDLDIVRWPDGQAYVPAAGFIGALHQRFYDEVDCTKLKTAWEILWGSEQRRGTKANQPSYQSHLRASDMKLRGKKKQIVTVRDGVRINHETYTADDGAKYDYEILEPGNSLVFQPEITLRAGFALEWVNDLKKLAAYMKKILETDFQIGGGTTRGFGYLKVTDFKIRHFDFSPESKSPEGDREAWFRYLKLDEFKPMGEWTDFPALLPRENFSIHADFTLEGSLIIGSAGGPNDNSDKVHLSSRGTPVISGKSLAGALRHRAFKVMQSLGFEQAEEKLHQLFGNVDLENDDKAIKSRLKTRESHLEGFQQVPQTRIRINRFTGGTMDSALFDSEPIWRSKGKTFTLKFEICQPKVWEKALLLHLLKDLWTGDLPIGGEKNIGRGRLCGLSATIHFNQEILELKPSENGFKIEGSPEAKASLEKAEAAFILLSHPPKSETA